MKPWKRRMLIAAIPVAAVTVGCVAAQDDMDALAKSEIDQRNLDLSDLPLLELEILELGPGSVFNNNDEERAAEAAAQWAEYVAGGHAQYDDLTLSALTRERIAVAYGVDEEGASDPCQVTVAMGGEALAEHTVTLRGYHTNAPGELFVMEQREGEEACEGESGFFFEETEAGTHGSIAMCPSSCDTFASSAEEGGAISLEVVIGEA